ncbi:phage portal protein [Mangrovicoccus ximenensis]|uniref:phage portal protein n=1 Tax=Mangrovicoccus ximenensis TaxID=1911570 RepID=UPI000D35D79B|nr:phage portal protein [Mangrovicoccus ximenensis]
MKLWNPFRQEPPAARLEPVVTASDVTASVGTSSEAGWRREIGFGGSGTRVAGLPPVSPVIAQRHATVTACCSVIAGDLSKLPLEVMRRGRDGREEPVPEHPANYLLNVESSPGVAAIGARFALGYAFCLRGEAFAYAPRDGAGELVLIEHIHNDLITPLRYGRERFYQFEDGAEIHRRAPGRVIAHLRYMSEDGWTGRSPLAVAAESVGIALAGQEAAAKAASGTNIKGYAKVKEYFDDDEAYQRKVRRLRQAMENGDIPIVGPDDEIKTLSMSPADQQLLESRKMDREQIAALYRVPPSKLQMLEHGVKANGQQQAIDYRADCLSHWGGFVEAQTALGILTEAERRAGLVLRHDYDALLTATTKERYEALNQAVGGPWMKANEARRGEGLKDTEEGDQLYPPPNQNGTENKAAAPTEGEDA